MQINTKSSKDFSTDAVFNLVTVGSGISKKRQDASELTYFYARNYESGWNNTGGNVGVSDKLDQKLLPSVSAKARCKLFDLTDKTQAFKYKVIQAAVSKINYRFWGGVCENKWKQVQGFNVSIIAGTGKENNAHLHRAETFYISLDLFGSQF